MTAKRHKKVPEPPQSEEKPRVMGRPRSEDSRRRILEAARELLQERGLRAMTICAIAERATTSKVTVYRWWSHKAAIVLEAMLSESGVVMPVRESASPLESVRAQLRAFVRFVGGPNGKLLRDVLAEGILDAEVGHACREHWVKPRREEMTRHLRRAMEEGEVSPELDVETTIDALMGPLYHRFLVRNVPLTPAFADRIFASATAGIVLPAARKRLGLV